MDKNDVPVTHPSKLRQHLDSVVKNAKSFQKFLLNKETNEFLGRDGLSWAKITFFYFIFYTALSSLFVGYLAIYVSTTIGNDRPKYVAEQSTMASRNSLNPGLGFRPQIDTEDMLIFYQQNDENQEKLTRNLDIFLAKKYESLSQTGTIIDDCENQDLEELRKKFRNESAYCQYDYKRILEGTSCDPARDYGYESGPCVLLKLNKIFEWVPEPFETFEKFPLDSSLLLNRTDLLTNNVIVSCDGEYPADQDALRQAKISYFSANSKILSFEKLGLLPNYYYPFLNQPGYKAPLVFIHFQNIPQNQLILVLCKAYSANIDSEDKINLRGMVRLQLFEKN
ncbi:sodium potassium-transporting ATPase subunit beta-2 [Brachionus plicatilis]|uniref:Sodium potassium-transporting ATPase subunit beta-2 n=1 Tax=Brachionus plicatilis TaxID=10195 RepID=A0A3M7RUI3_BRAPC|nr:sodium potassium-transporting ATPase subunit beta-2 [Brachionus plicatilis]